MANYQCQKCGGTQSTTQGRKCPDGGNCVWRQLSRFVKSIFTGL